MMTENENDEQADDLHKALASNANGSTYGVAYNRGKAVELCKMRRTDSYGRFYALSTQHAVIQFLKIRIEESTKAVGNAIELREPSTKVVYVAKHVPDEGFIVTVHVVNMRPLSVLRIEIEMGSEVPVIEDIGTTKQVFPD